MKTFRLVNPNNGRVISVKGSDLREAQFMAASDPKNHHGYFSSDYKPAKTKSPMAKKSTSKKRGYSAKRKTLSSKRKTSKKRVASITVIKFRK